MVTEEEIAQLVDSFYTAVKDDELLGPVFAGAIGDWGPHLAKMRAFWSSVMLGSGSYKGSPMMAHLRLPGIGREHFDRWLELWEQILAGQPLTPLARATFLEKAQFMGERLLSAVSVYGEVVRA